MEDYTKDSLKVEYQSQSDQFDSGAILTAGQMDNIDAGILKAASAEKVAEALKELNDTITTTKTGLESQITTFKDEVDTQIQDNNTQIQNDLSVVRDEVAGKADKITTDTNAKNKYWKFDEDGNLTFAELQMDNKLDNTTSTDNTGKFVTVDENGNLVFGEIQTESFSIVNILPTQGQPHLDYFLKQGEYYHHYRWIENDWHLINNLNSFGVFNTLLSNVQVLTDKNSANESDISDLQTEVSALDEFKQTYEIKYENDYLTLYSVRGEEREQIGSSYHIVSAGEKQVSSEITIGRVSPTTVDYSDSLSNMRKIEYTFSSIDTDDGGPTGKATATWTINGRQVLVETIDQGPNQFEPYKYISEAGDYTIYLSLMDSYGATKRTRWAVKVINMYLVPELDDSEPFFSDVETYYTPYGSLDKTIYIYLDGELFHSELIKDDGLKKSLNIPFKSHGAHTLTMQLKAKLGEEDIYSPTYYYDLMFVEQGNNTPIISWPYSDEPLQQYRNTSFNFRVYSPDSYNSKISFLVNGEKIGERTVERGNEHWDYRPDDLENDQDGEKDGVQRILTISVDGTQVQKSKTLTVEPFPYDVSQIATGLQLDFNPTGRTNNDVGYTHWSYSPDQKNTYTMSVSEDFDWDNGGWKIDDQGAYYFCIKAGSRMTLNYPLFGDNATTNGKNFKCIYKATNCREFKAPVMSCQGIYKVPYPVLDEETGEPIIDPETGEEMIELRDTPIGVEMNAQDATINGKIKLEVPYVEDEIIAFEFNLDKNIKIVNGQAVDNHPVATVLLNADPSRTVSSSDAALNQSTYGTAKNITFGSDTCDVHLYRFKAYNIGLSDDEILQNYIADSLNADEMLERYERNDFLTQNKKYTMRYSNGASFEYPDIDYQKLSQLYPDLRILLITCPRFTYDKDDKVKGCTVQQIMGNGLPEHNWIARNVQLKGQGTSSNEYGTSARNLDLKFNKYNTSVIESTKENGDPVYKQTAFEYVENDVLKYANKYSMTDNSIGVNYFNIKVNVASSEGANNAMLADRYNKFNPYKRPERIANEKVRDTMEFHPCVIFVQELGTDEEGNQEFPADGRFHFYACGDFGNSKKNHEVFGMDTDAYDNYMEAVKEQNSDTPTGVTMPNECIVEVSNNTQPQCRYKMPEGYRETVGIMPDNDPGGLKLWNKGAVEFRYPEDLFDIIENKDNEYSDIEVSAATKVESHLRDIARRLWVWVESTDTTLVPSLYKENAQGELVNNTTDTFNRIPIPDPLTGIVTGYLDNYTGEDGTIYTVDSKEYRRAKFIKEFSNYFIKDSVLYYYLFTERYLMIDNRAKNTFLHTADGVLWDFCFDYDNDTSLGCDNVGDLKYDYGIEDIDYTADGTPIYNASDSVLWVNVRNCFHDELETMAKSLQAAFAAGDDDLEEGSGLLQQFAFYQSYKPERLQMIDMRRKYIRPFTDGHNGEGEYTRYLTMLNGKKTLQRKRFEKYMEVYMDSKYRTSRRTTDLFTFRTYAPPLGQEGVEQDIWNYHITPYCDLYVCIDDDTVPGKPVRVKAGEECVYKRPGTAPYQNTNVKIFSASMISSVGDLSPFYLEFGGFENGEKLLSIQLGSNKTGYKNEKLEDLELNNPLLENVNIQNCKKLTSLNLEQCVSVKTVNTVGSGVSDIRFANYGLLETATLNTVSTLFLRNLKRLQTLSLTSYSAIQKLWLEKCATINPKSFIENCTNLLALRAIGVDFGAIADGSYSFLDRLFALKGIDALGQDITESTIEGHGGSVLDGRVGYNTIASSKFDKYKEAWPTLTIDYVTMIPQHLVTFKDWNGAILWSEYVDNGGTVLNPLREGGPLTDDPYRAPNQQYTYTFTGWDVGDDYFGSVQIYKPVTIFAQYASTTNEYWVTWKESSTGQTYHSQRYKYGEEAVCPEDKVPTVVNLSATGDSCKLFLGWNLSTGKVVEDIEVHAVWENGIAITDAETVGGVEKLNAANLLAAHNANLVDVVKANATTLVHVGDKLTIPLGYRPQYPGIDLIPPHTYLDGDTVIHTGEKPLAIDQDWTLFFDFEYTHTIDKNTNQVLLSCYSENHGFKVEKYRGSGSTAVGPKLYWGQNSETIGYSGNDMRRESFVLRHQAGDTKVKAYFTRPYYYDDEDKVVKTREAYITKATVTILPETEIIFGARYDARQEIYLDYAKGYVHHAKLWYQDLGETECKKMTRWHWDDTQWVIVDGKSYESAETPGKKTVLDLMCTKRFETSIPLKANIDTTDKDENGNPILTNDYPNFPDSNLAKWLNSRVLKAFPSNWRVLLQKTNVPCTKQNGPTIQNDADPHDNIQNMNIPLDVWLPSMYEMGQWKNKYPYNEEGIPKKGLGTALNNFRGLWPFVPVYQEINGEKVVTNEYITTSSSSDPIDIYGLDSIPEGAKWTTQANVNYPWTWKIMYGRQWRTEGSDTYMLTRTQCGGRDINGRSPSYISRIPNGGAASQSAYRGAVSASSNYYSTPMISIMVEE